MSKSKNGQVQTGKLVEGEIIMNQESAVNLEKKTLEVYVKPTIEVTPDTKVHNADVVKGEMQYLEGATIVNVKTSVECKFENKSDMFRALYDAGYTVGAISALCKSHYSFVYGVISGSRELAKVSKDSKSDAIRKLVDESKTPGEIAKELNSNYSFVHSVVKKYKSEKVQAAV